MTTTRNLADTDLHDLPLDMSEQAHAANAALFAGRTQIEVARQAWALVKETYPTAYGRDLDDAPKGEQIARRLAVRLEQAARSVLGLVSSSAAGLWGVDAHGRIARIEDTSGGSDYFDGVRYRAQDGGYESDVPVKDFVAFFDTAEDAAEWLNPTPRKGFLG